MKRIITDVLGWQYDLPTFVNEVGNGPSRLITTLDTRDTLIFWNGGTAACSYPMALVSRFVYEDAQWEKI